LGAEVERVGHGDLLSSRRERKVDRPKHAGKARLELGVLQFLRIEMQVLDVDCAKLRASGLWNDHRCDDPSDSYVCKSPC